MLKSDFVKSILAAGALTIVFVVALIFLEKDKAQGMDATAGEVGIYASSVYLQKAGELPKPTAAELKALLAKTLPPWTSSAGPTSWHYMWTVQDAKDFIFCVEFRVEENGGMEELGFIYDLNKATTNIQLSCGEKPQDVSMAKAL